MPTGDHHRLGVLDEAGVLVEDPDWRRLYWSSTDNDRVAEVTGEAITSAIAVGVISAETVAQAHAEGRVHWLIDLGRAVFVVLVAGQPIGVVPYSSVAVASNKSSGVD